MSELFIHEEENWSNIENNKIFPVNPKGLVPFSFIPILIEWLEYKKEKGQSYKPKGFISLCRRALKLSNGDANVLADIVENSMSCNYAGLFPIKINTHEKNRSEWGTENNANIADQLRSATWLISGDCKTDQSFTQSLPQIGSDFQPV